MAELFFSVMFFLLPLVGMLVSLVIGAFHNLMEELKGRKSKKAGAHWNPAQCIKVAAEGFVPISINLNEHRGLRLDSS